MATNNIPVVYLQNSGLGNTLNPIMSLAHKDVYSIPILLIIGWRGEPGLKDEPQHFAQGKKMLDQLKSMDIEYEVISSNEWQYQIDKILNKIISPRALIIRKNTFSKSTRVLKKLISNNYKMTRERSIEIIAKSINSPIISTTGKCSRELFEIRKRNNQKTNDFYTVGSMGHTLSISQGVAIGKKSHVVCLDGDGSLIMHMGSTLLNNNLEKKSSILHIVLNNNCHESVGSQPTFSENINFKNFGKSIGYNEMYQVSTESGLIEVLKKINLKKNTLLEILITPSSRDDLGRPDSHPIDNKINFMSSLNK